jgi:hypothetical protein
VLHAARGIFHSLAEAFHHEGAAQFFRMGACNPEHAFERVYLTAEYAEPPLPPACLFSELDPPEERERLQRSRVISVPANRYWFASVTATKGPDGQGQITGTMARPDQVRIVLQPLDKNLEIDYSHVLAVPAHETWNRADMEFVDAWERQRLSAPHAQSGP